MIKIRKAEDRGKADHGWLKSRHTFSFGDYYDPAFMGYSVLRVINEDRIEGGTGFATHGHRDMEIISYVVDGALEHKDSMGTETIIRPGEVQRMTAGTGVRHSEFNKLPDQKTHFLQIWIEPEKIGDRPGYDQKSFADRFESSNLVLVGSRTGREGSIVINQDVNLYACKSTQAGQHVLKTSKNRHAWIQLIKGEATVEGENLAPGDGAAIEQVEAFLLEWTANSELLVFDLR